MRIFKIGGSGVKPVKRTIGSGTGKAEKGKKLPEEKEKKPKRKPKSPMESQIIKLANMDAINIRARFKRKMTAEGPVSEANEEGKKWRTFFIKGGMASLAARITETEVKGIYCLKVYNAGTKKWGLYFLEKEVLKEKFSDIENMAPFDKRA